VIKRFSHCDCRQNDESGGSPGSAMGCEQPGVDANSEDDFQGQSYLHILRKWRCRLRMHARQLNDSEAQGIFRGFISGVKAPGDSNPLRCI
jgi:hypothetical protein